jgi:hypothetical protein
MHAASCDAVGASAIGLTPPPVVARVDVVRIAVVTGTGPRDTVRPVTESPPLFILHAALLI